MIEAARYIALHKPDCACPLGPYLSQCGVASPSRSKSVCVATELRFVVRFQEHADDFLHEFR